MSLFRILLLVFITVPLLEIYLLFQVGGLLGLIPTIGLCVLTAILGASLLRIQGLQTIAQIQGKLEQGEIPAVELVGGAILLLSGALLLTPGFFTDGVGFLCLLPRLRYRMVALLLTHYLRPRPGTAADGPATLEGEFWEEDNHRLPR